MAISPDDDLFSSADTQYEPVKPEGLEGTAAETDVRRIQAHMEEDLSMQQAQLRSLLGGSASAIPVPLCQSEREIRTALSSVEQLLAGITGSSIEEEPPDEKVSSPSVEHIVNVLLACRAHLAAIEVGLRAAPEVAESKQTLEQLQTEEDTTRDALTTAQAGGTWKRLWHSMARNRATNTLAELKPRKERAQKQYEDLQDTYKEHHQAYEALCRKVREACIEGAEQHFRTILQKDKDVFDALKHPERKSEWNERLLDIHVRPVLAQVVEEGELTPDEAETYLGLVKEVLREGYDSRSIDHEEPSAWERRHARNDRLSEFSRKAYELSDVLSSVSANDTDLIGDQFYDVHLRLLINQETKKRIQKEVEALVECTQDEALQQRIRECANSVVRGPDDIQKRDLRYPWKDSKNMRNVDIETWHYKQIPMDGIERWKILKKSPLLQTVITPETFAEVEKCMAGKLGKGYLVAGGRESWEGTQAAAVLDEIGTPHAIPYILELFERSGAGHTSASAAYHLERLLQKTPAAEIDAALAEYPQDMRDTIALLHGGNQSYFKRFSNSNYVFAHILQNRKRTLRQEQIAAAMEHDGTSDADLQSFYMLEQDKPALLASLWEYAESIGVSEKALVEEYFDELTSRFSLEYAESAGLIRNIARVLGETPQNIFERKKQAFHLQEHSELHHRCAAIALRNICDIAYVTGFRKKDLVKEFLPDLLTGIYTYSDDIVEFVRSLSTALEEPPSTSLARIQPRLEGHLRYPVQFLEQLRGLSALTGTAEKDLVEARFPQFLEAIHRVTVRELPDALATSLGCTRAEIMRKFSEANPHGFTFCAERNDWRALHTEAIFSDFLAALPTDTDERRNAFTHNPYDRTSEFMTTMNRCQEFDFRSARGMEDITEYVKKFGLSKTGILFEYFQNLRKLERKEVMELPEEQRQNGITTMAKLEDRVKQFRILVYGEKPLIETQNFNNFELEMLATVTNHSAHRFERGRPSLQNIVTDFTRNTEQQAIEPVPPEYGVSTFTIDQVHIDFDPEKIQEDFGILSGEILRSIEQGSDITDIRERACALLRRNTTDLEAVLEKQPQNKFILQQMQSAQAVLAAVEKAQDVDGLIKALLDMQRAQAEKYDIAGIIREALFHKFLEKHYSPAMIQNLQMTLGRGASPQGVLAIVDVVQNSIKDHILNLEDNNQEAYWPEDCWKKIQEKKGKKTSLDLRMVYEGRIKALKKEAENFRQISTGNTTKVRAIPDRGLIGEMSGYLANACYTAEYPLLVKYPNVVPVKFVSGEEGSPDAELIGSLLYFEIETESGKALLVRAFNVPNEASLDIHAFIEENLDRAAETAKKRGCTQVLVPGVSGAISNYPLTYNHIHKNYIAKKAPVKLKQKFAFNNYDLTKACFIAREIKEENV